MKSEIKAKWLAGLRSGQYRQNFGCLHQDGRFCVLGVLADLYLQDTGRKWERTIAGQHLYAEDNGYYLSDSILNWAGLPLKIQHPDNPAGNLTGNGTIWVAGLADYLSALNDGGMGFERLAGVIETYL